jgi:Zn-dependent M28 family amino/carboxypeptidase
MKISLSLILALLLFSVQAQQDQRLHDIIADVSADRLESDIRRLANFGTRHTMSETKSNTRGIGAARRWIKSEFESISSACGNCLEVSMQRTMVEGDEKSRIPTDTEVVNVLAIKRGNKYPNRYVIMAGDIDSRISDGLNFTDDSPGANDNASGMAGVIEAARVLSKYDFENTILFVGLYPLPNSIMALDLNSCLLKYFKPDGIITGT